MSEQDKVEMARLAEHAERYEEMAGFMEKLVEERVNANKEISEEERSLLSVAFKNVIGSRRQSWRIISSQEKKFKDSHEERECAKKYREKIEGEMTDIIEKVTKLLDDKLIKEDVPDDDKKAVEAQIFFYKMKGDYCRYRAEYSKNEDGSKKDDSDCIEKGAEAYKKATELAKVLPSTNPTRLGLALNYSVFYYEINQESAMACEIAKKAFDEAIADLDSSTETSYKDSTLIMQLLRDNLTLWTSDQHGDEDVDQN